MGGLHVENKRQRRSVGASIIIFATIKPRGCPRIPSVHLLWPTLASHDGSEYVAVQGRIVRLGIPNCELSLLRPSFLKGPQHEPVKPLHIMFLSPAMMSRLRFYLQAPPLVRYKPKVKQFRYYHG